MKNLFKIFTVLTMFIMLSGCVSNQGAGTGIGTATGAGIGAIVGQAIGHNTKGTLIGAGIGALAGGLAGNLIGSYMDKQEEQLRQLEMASIKREQDVLSATFQGDLFFDFDSAELKPGANSELVRVANVLNSYPQTTIMIEGHTDAKGKPDYNQKLSERRALTVKTALVNLGVDSVRLNTVGYGATRIISSSDAVNRRVVIVINPIRQS